MKKINKKGFTLVELVIVIAVLIILAAIAIPTVSGVISNANAATDAANAKTIESIIKLSIIEREKPDGVLHNLIGDALKASGLSYNFLDCKQKGYKFYYNRKAGTIVVAKTAPPDCEEAEAGTKIIIKEDED